MENNPYENPNSKVEKEESRALSTYRKIAKAVFPFWQAVAIHTIGTALIILFDAIIGVFYHNKLIFYKLMFVPIISIYLFKCLYRSSPNPKQHVSGAIAKTWATIVIAAMFSGYVLKLD